MRDRRTRQPMAPYNGSSPEMAAIKKSLLDSGVFLYTHWHTLLLLPPLIINEQQLAEGFSAIDHALGLADRAAG